MIVEVSGIALMYAENSGRVQHFELGRVNAAHDPVQNKTDPQPDDQESTEKSTFATRTHSYT